MTAHVTLSHVSAGDRWVLRLGRDPPGPGFPTESHQGAGKGAQVSRETQAEAETLTDGKAARSERRPLVFVTVQLSSPQK